MPTLNLQGTVFTVECLRPKLFSDGWGKVAVAVKNEHIDYCDDGRSLLISDVEEWIFAMYRLLAGAYSSVYSLSFERAGIAVDLFPYESDSGVGGSDLRDLRRKNDCTMALRLLMRSADKRSFLGGVYTLLLHREHIRSFADGLRKEFDKNYGKHVHGRGKFVFVGVSPLGYEGCNYWYLDESETAKKGDYVWVRMGRHHTEQIVYVGCVRRFTEDNAPYDPSSVKRVLRKATEEDLREWGL